MPPRDDLLGSTPPSGPSDHRDAAPDDADARLVDELVRLFGAMTVWTARLIDIIGQVDRSGLWARQGAKTCAHWLGWRLGMGPGAAREHVRVARALAEREATRAAFAAGRITYSKVRAITRVMNASNEATLIGYAEASPAYVLERICRRFRSVVERKPSRAPRRSLRHRRLDDGTMRITIDVPADEGALILNAVESVQAERGALDVSAETSEPESTAGAKPIEDPGSATDTVETAVCAPPNVSAETSDDEPFDYAETLGIGAFEEEDVHTPSPLEEEMAAWSAGTHPRLSHGDAPPEASSGRRVEDEAEAKARTADEDDRVNALLQIAEDVVRSGLGRTEEPSSLPPPAELVVHVSAETLEDPEHPDADPPVAEAGGDVPLASGVARMVACDCVVRPLLENGAEPLAIGRRSRVVPLALRRALDHRDGGCRFPGCTNHRFVDRHHVKHWVDGGATDLDNLVTLCRRHHRAVHEEGWSIRPTSDGDFEFVAPHGRIVPAAPGLSPPEIDTLETMLYDADARREGSLRPAHWDGRPVDLALAIDRLVEHGLEPTRRD